MLGFMSLFLANYKYYKMNLGDWQLQKEAPLSYQGYRGRERCQTGRGQSGVHSEVLS